MKKLLLLFLTISGSYWTYAQVCGTPQPANPIIYSTYQNARSAGFQYCIDVFFHIVRRTNRTNAFPPPDTDAIVSELNEFFSPHDIVINNAGMDFIDDSDLVVINADNGEDSTPLTLLFTIHLIAQEKEKPLVHHLKINDVIDQQTGLFETKITNRSYN